MTDESISLAVRHIRTILFDLLSRCPNITVEDASRDADRIAAAVERDVRVVVAESEECA